MNYIRQITLLFISLFCIISSLYPQQNKDEILFVSSYNYDTQYTYRFILDFTKEYQDAGGKLPIVIENMNLFSFSEADLWRGKLESILRKHPQVKLMVLLGGEAWQAYLETTEPSCHQIPVMMGMAPHYGIDFMQGSPDNTLTSINLFNRIKQHPNIVYCQSYHYDVNENIQLIKRFFPSTRNIVFLSDDTYNGMVQLALVRKRMQKHPELKLIEINGRFNTLKTAAQQMKKIPANSVLLLGTWRYDYTGVSYMDNGQLVFETAHPSLPVFSINSTAIGKWAIGGYIPDYRNMFGFGKRAYQVLESKEKLSQELESLPMQYKFDENRIRAFHKEDIALPKESIIINKQKAFWDIYKQEVHIAILLAFLFCAAFALFVYYYVRNLKLKNQLQLYTNKLLTEREQLIESQQELRKAKEEAEQAKKMQNAFVNNMTHEIRTPLNAIVGFSSILLSELGNCSETQKEYMNIVSENSNRLLQLVSDVFEISRLDSNPALNYEKCDVVIYCRNIISVVKESKKPTVELRLETSQDSLLIDTDLTLLQQILLNLLTNAVKFTKEGSITLRLEQDTVHQEILFSVTDTGIGITKENAKQIFERFVKVNDYVSGTGLGLPICKLCVEHLGGHIWVDEDYQTGARICFTHPTNIHQ